LYDVTDDWRFSAMGWATRRRLLRAESVLARKARTVVCSDELAARWQDRFHVKAAVVRNGVDVDAVRSATPRQLEEPGPHAAYVGTLHDERLDVDLVLALALSGCVNRIHLVGPDHLEPQSRSRLLDTGRVSIPGPARRDEVPGWLQAADVLLLPHRISPFTLSLDAIKAHEYLATQKPIVATPTSGFQGLQPTPGLTVTTADRFGDAVSAAVELGPTDELRVVADWDDRAREFGAIIAELMASGDQAI
jgi:glycosyltransferase involved in cell wall biosynthesis